MKRGRDKENRIIPGGKRMRTLWMCYEQKRTSKDDKQGRKRSIKLEAKEEECSNTDMRLLQSPRKKTNGIQKAIEHGKMANPQSRMVTVLVSLRPVVQE